MAIRRLSELSDAVVNSPKEGELTVSRTLSGVSMLIPVSSVGPGPRHPGAVAGTALDRGTGCTTQPPDRTYLPPNGVVRGKCRTTTGSTSAHPGAK
jgi:hypothetical protein